MQAASPRQPLRHRIIRAGTWALGGHMASQAIRLLSNLIMTRLLVPEMFGIMAVANVLMIGLALFSDLGLRQNIIQSHRGHDPIFLNTVWTVQIIRGAGLWLLALLMALAIYLFAQLHWWPGGSVYAEPILPYVIAALSFTALVSGFESTKLATASRKLALGRFVIIDLLGQVAGFALTLAWVYVDRSIWALVAGALVAGLLKVLLSHIVLPGERNRLHWDEAAFSDIFAFGKWVFLSSILGFLAANGDRLVLGGLTDASTLGLYSIAFMMVNTLRDILNRLISGVAFPAFSEVVRDRPAMLKQVYYKFRAPIDRASLLAAGAFFVAGDLVIRVLYDQRYASAGHMMEVLAIGLLEVRYGLVQQCFLALAKPNLLVPIKVIQLIALYLMLPLAFAAYGMEGALWIAGCGMLFTVPLVLYYKIKYGLFDLGKELRVLPWFAVGLALGWLVNLVVGMVGWG